MAFELITGHAGRNHVDSADMGEAFAGIVGKGRYILDTGEGMACTMSDSNTLTVGTGSMLMDGRIVRNETAATFKIANGTQGQYRHDLACLRYTLDRSNDSIESVEQVVLQGTPATTAGEAKDPDYEAGDILSGDLSATVPIARVKLDNLTPTCEAMLGSVTSLKALGESVFPRKLWSGKADSTSGTPVNIPGLSDCRIAFIRTDQQDGLVPIEVKNGTYTYGGALCRPNSYELRSYGGNVTIDGESMTFTGGLFASLRTSLGAAAVMTAGDRFYIVAVYGQ